MSTFMAKKENLERKWYVIDAADKPLGRTAVLAGGLHRSALAVRRGRCRRRAHGDPAFVRVRAAKSRFRPGQGREALLSCPAAGRRHQKFAKTYPRPRSERKARRNQ